MRDDTFLSDPAERGGAEASLTGRRRAENFPVALRVLPAALRRDLVAVYDVARSIDYLGDEAPGDRTAQLTRFSGELAAIWAGGPVRIPVLRRLAVTVVDRDLPEEPFQRLVQANLADQVVHRYQTYNQLLGYCALSAEPVGRIVLRLFGAGGTEVETRSDAVCTALQILEHCQDVAEDVRADRVYLPAEDLDRFGVTVRDLAAATASPAVCRLLALQVDRAEELLGQGPALVGRLRGWARHAVAGYLAGGRATVAALRRADHDVLAVRCRPRRRDLARHLAALEIGALR